MPELAKLTLVFGGASSGKSAFAERLIMASDAPRVYLATAQVFDVEMAQKIKAHHDMRGPDWQTIEAPYDLQPALGKLRPDQVCLLDCATMWLSNHMLAEHDIKAETTALLTALTTCKGRVVIVSNELGHGVVPDNALARRFRDAQGKLNQELAAVADLAVFVLAGLPQVLKGQLP